MLSIHSNLKGLSLGSALMISNFVWGADIAVVIDDSSGMCGYLTAPFAQNSYKQALMKLQEARNSGSLSMQVYYLSNPSKALSSGQAFDSIIAATSKSCPFKATSSPLHTSMDSKIIKESSVILVTDLLFDGGAAGSSDSRAKFIDQFDTLIKKSQQSEKTWFNVSAGMMGIKSNFNGPYYSTSGQPKIDLGIKPTERPFYLIWKSSTGKFWPFLNQMNLLWKTPNWSGKKWAHEGAFAIRFLPTFAIVQPKNNLLMLPVQPIFGKNAQGSYPAILPSSVFYGKKSGKLLDPVFSVDKVVSADAANPNECFSQGASPLELQFKKACGKDGAREQAFFGSDQPINSVVFAFPVLDHLDGIKRTISLIPTNGGYTNKAEINYRDAVNTSDALRQSKGADLAKGGVVLSVGSLRGAKSIFYNGSVGNNMLVYQLSEKYEVRPVQQMSAFMNKINVLWSSDVEPCVSADSSCQQADKATYQLSSLINSMNIRLSANQHAAELLNRAAPNQVVSLKMIATP